MNSESIYISHRIAGDTEKKRFISCLPEGFVMEEYIWENEFERSVALCVAHPDDPKSYCRFRCDFKRDDLRVMEELVESAYGEFLRTLWGQCSMHKFRLDNPALEAIWAGSDPDASFDAFMRRIKVWPDGTEH